MYLLNDLIKHTDDEKAGTIAGREKQKGDRKERRSKPVRLCIKVDN